MLRKREVAFGGGKGNKMRYNREVNRAELAQQPRGHDLSEATCRIANATAFAELVCRYQNPLYNTVYRLVENHEDAHDVVQDTFLKAYQALDTFQGDSRFFTWLYQIAINTAISFRRKQRIRVQAGSTGGTLLIEPVDQSASTNPGHALELAEQEQRIRVALARLSPDHRAVLILKDMDGHKYEELAEILRLPIGTVRSQLHRARLKLRAILEQMDEGQG
jgi:RNA polymerase sigma-70 factor (ECF subfamily)